MTDSMPYGEVAKFLAQHADLVTAALSTLRYVDVALLAPRIRATSLLSVGLMDDVCPPSTVFAAYNAIDAPKQIAVYPFGVHALAHAHLELQLRHMHEHLAEETV